MDERIKVKIPDIVPVFFKNTYMKYIFGTKKEMTQMFEESGVVQPVTLVCAEPVEVSLIRTKEKDGYDAVQVRKGNVSREFRLRTSDSSFAAGLSLSIGQFKEGDKVIVAGISKGKGFQGGMKRHGFHGAPKTHGTKHAHRQPGSISGIGRGGSGGVHKGKRMAGRMGSDKVTMRGVRVVRVYEDKNIIALKGGLPGNRGSLVEIRG